MKFPRYPAVFSFVALGYVASITYIKSAILRILVFFFSALNSLGNLVHISFFSINSSKPESVPLSPCNSFTSFRENSNLNGVLNASRIAGICDSIASFESLHSKNPYAFPIFSMILYGSFLYKPSLLSLLLRYNITKRFINPILLYNSRKTPDKMARQDNKEQDRKEQREVALINL